MALNEYDTETMVQDEQQNQPEQSFQQDPPSKKLWQFMVDKGVYNKKYDEFSTQFSTPEKISKLHSYLTEKQLYTKSPEDFNSQFFTDVSQKKKVGKINLDLSSLESGNSLSQSSGEDLPKIDTGNGELVAADPISLSRKYNDLKKIKIQSILDMNGKVGDMAMDEANKISKDNQGVDLNGIYNETNRLTDYDFERIPKAELLKDREENKPFYLRKIAHLNWTRELDKSLDNYVGSGYISLDEAQSLRHQIESSLANSNVGDYNQQRENVNNVANAIKKFGGENADTILKDYATEVSKVYGNSYNSGFDKSVANTPESKYLNNYAQLGLHFVKDLDPEKAAQYERLFIDPKTLKDKPDELRGYNHLMQTLEETGIGLQQNSVTEELNALNNTAKKNNVLTPEQLERAKNLEAKNDELNKARQELDNKYPERREDKIDDAIQELTGQRLSWGQYAGGKSWNAIKHTGQGIWEAISSPFMSDGSNSMRELALMGQQNEEESLYHTTDKNKNYLTDKLVIEPDLQKQINEIKNEKGLTLDEVNGKLYNLLRNNPDKFGRVPISGGKYNISPSSILYGVTEIGTSLLPFIALEAVTGGGATASATRKFLSTFTAAAATSFHDEYTNAVMSGKSQSEAYKEAMGMTAISSAAMAGAGTAEKVKAFYSGGKTSAAKLIQGMSDEAIEKVLAKGTPQGLKAISSSIKERIKATPGMFAKGLKTGAEFELAMTGANELKHQIYGSPIDRENNFKQAILQVANFGILGAGLGHFGFKSPTELQRSGLLEFGKKSDEYLAIAEQMKKDGNLTEDEFNHRTNLIQLSKEAYKTLPKALDNGKPLSEKDKAEYIYNSIIKNEGNKAKNSLPPKQSLKAEMTALVADHANDLILNPQTDNQLQSRKNKIEKELEPKKDENGKVTELPEQEKKNLTAELEAINNKLEQNKKEVSNVPKQTAEEINKEREDELLQAKQQLDKITEDKNNTLTPEQIKVEEQKYQKTVEGINKWHDAKLNELPKEEQNKESALPELTVPIEGTNNKGIPVGENVPAETTPSIKGEVTIPIKVGGEEINVKYLDEYKGKKIVEIDGNIHVYDPKAETVFNVALDDSNGEGRKIIPESNNIESAKKYIDWATETRKENTTPTTIPVQAKEVKGKDVVVDEERTYTKNALDRADAKKIYQQVREVSKPTDAEQVALEYLANGGKVSEQAINEIAGSVKRASLNTGARELKTNEVKGRDYADKKSESLDQLAHNLWELHDQKIDESEIKDALMNVIKTHNTRLEAGKAYLEKYSPEYQEKKLQEKFYQDHMDEIEAEEKAINDYLNSEKEIESEAFADEKFVTNLIEKYEADTKGENKQSPTKTESSTNKGTGSETSNEKTKTVNEELPDTKVKQSPETKIPTTEEPNKEVPKAEKGTGGNEPPKGEVKEDGNDGEDWTAIRKEKQVEVDAVKKAYEEQGVKGWSESMKQGLQKVQKLFPDKNLYDSALSLMHQIRMGGKHGDLTADEALATMHYLKMEIERKRSELVKDFTSDNSIERELAAFLDDSLQSDYENTALAAKGITTEAGRTLSYAASEIRLHPKYGLQIRRMELMKKKGEPLSEEDMKWTEAQWDKEKEIMKQEEEIRSQQMKEEFDNKIAELQKEYEDRVNNNKSATPVARQKRSQQIKDIAQRIRTQNELDKFAKAAEGTIHKSSIFGDIDFKELAAQALEYIAKGVEKGEDIKKMLSDAAKKFKGKFDEDDFKKAINFIVTKSSLPTKEEVTDKIKAFVKENDVTDITNEMVGANLIRDYVNSHIGEVKQKDLFDKAFKDLKKELPDLTKEKLIEAYIKKGEFKQFTKKELEGGVKESKLELKRIAKRLLTADQQQKIKLQSEKENTERKMEQFKKKLQNEEFEEQQPTVKLKKSDAELIRLNKQQSVIEEAYRKKQNAYKEKNKSRLERAADFARSAYIAILIGAPKTLAKVASMSLMRPISEASSKLTFGKVFDAFFPKISEVAKRGGESSSWRSVQTGFEAYFRQMGNKKMEKMYENASSEYDRAARAYSDYKKSANPDTKKLEQLKMNANNKLMKVQGSFIYKFIGGSSLKDALKALVNRSNEIEKQFGKVEGESIKDGNWLDKANYVLGFIGRSHSAAKTFSGRFSFAAGFMARLEGAVKNGEDISSPDKILEIAHESYLDWERGKYQQSNQISDLWNKLTNNISNGEIGTDREGTAKVMAALLKTEVAITRVPVNILHEAIMEYTFGAFKALAMAAKNSKEIKAQLKEEGFTNGEKLVDDITTGTSKEDFKKALKEKISQMDEKQAATIARCFRKGGLGVGLYATALITAAIHFGIFPHMGQKKKKEEDQLAPDELNPGQIMVGDTKLGEVTSGIIEHIPALWPMFMGLGMAQAYDDEIKKGKSTKEAVIKSIYTHLKVVESGIPQSKIISPTRVGETIYQGIKKKAENSGLIDTNKTGYSDTELDTPEKKIFTDRGVKIEIPKDKKAEAFKVDGKEISDEDFKKVQDEWKVQFDALTKELYEKGLRYYPEGKGTENNPKPYEVITLDDKDQIKEVLDRMDITEKEFKDVLQSKKESISDKAKKIAMNKIFPDKVKLPKGVFDLNEDD